MSALAVLALFVTQVGAQDIAFMRDKDLLVVSGDGTGALTLVEDAGRQPSWSPDGRRIAFSQQIEGWTFHIFSVDTDGEDLRQLTRGESTDMQPDWSPDGSRIVFQRGDGGLGVYSIFIMNADGSSTRRLTDHPRADVEPDWSPDGREIVFASDRDSTDVAGYPTPNRELYVMRADGSEVRRLTRGEYADFQPTWSPDGKKVAFVSERPSPVPGVVSSWDIFVIDIDGTNERRLTEWPAIDTNPTWSPDGTQIAFERQLEEVPSGDNFEIFVMNADGSDQRNITNNPAQDKQPDWLWPRIVSSLTPVGKHLDTWGGAKEARPQGH